MTVEINYAIAIATLGEWFKTLAPPLEFNHATMVFINFVFIFLSL